MPVGKKLRKYFQSTLPFFEEFTFIHLFDEWGVFILLLSPPHLKDVLKMKIQTMVL